MKYKAILCPHCGCETPYTKSYRDGDTTIKATICTKCFAVVDNETITPYEADI